MTYKTLAATCLLIASTIAQSATAISGTYARLSGGVNFVPNSISSRNANDAVFRTGYLIGGQFGYKTGPIRYEIDGSYAYNRLKRFDFNNVRQTSLTGKASIFSVTLNAIYDFDETSAGISPYLGGGIGYGQIAKRAVSSAPTAVTRIGKSNSLLYKGMAGMSYHFSESASTDLNYMYSRSRKKVLGRVYQAHAFNLGLTYRFDK